MKQPDASVVVPAVVPVMKTVAPTTGSPFSASVIRPLTVRWADNAKGMRLNRNTKNKLHGDNIPLTKFATKILKKHST